MTRIATPNMGRSRAPTLSHLRRIAVVLRPRRGVALLFPSASLERVVL